MTDQCWDCAFKHLSRARITWEELRLGYFDDIGHISKVVGDLSHAEHHIHESDLVLAERIRQDRVVLTQQLAMGSAPEYRPAFEEYMAVCWEHITEAANGQEEEKEIKL